MKLVKKTTSSFLALNIAQKMYFGFFPLVVFLVLFSTFSLTKLNELNNLNESILTINIPIQETIRQMKSTVIDQESILRRFLILKDSAFVKVFNDNSIEFSEKINLLHSLADKSSGLNFPIAGLEKAYSDYSNVLLTGMSSREEPNLKTGDFDLIMREKQTALFDILAEFSVLNKSDQNQKTGISASIGSIAFKFALVICIIGITLSAIGAALVTNNIVNAVKKLQHATEEISQGRFDHLPDIKNKDELGELAKAFVRMGKRLRNFEETYLDANPLTRLPGGIAIENMLKKRIEADELFAFCMLDIDNFKSFNDRYGYAQGNEMIQATATIIEKCTSQHGSPEDFVGHIGGDDFVIISTPDNYKDICQAIIEKFDEKIPSFYSCDDRKRGYITGEDRQGKKMTFPLATISIAAVTNQYRILDSHIEVGEIAAEIKEHSKSIVGSSLVTDHRHDRESEGKDQGKLINFPNKVT